MPKFKIETPVRVEHIEHSFKHGVCHRIIDVEDNVLFEKLSVGIKQEDHTGLKSLYDQVAAAINYKYHRVQS